MPPLIFAEPNEQRIRDGDTVLFFNFRADRARQLSQAFLFQDFDGFDREVWPRVHYVTLTEYDVTYDCPIVFGPQSLKNILGDVVSAAGKTQLRIAETEKYPHVTYFFNGGVEKPAAGEDRKIIPSPKVATYDLQPEMSAVQVTDEVLSRLAQYDLIILNLRESRHGGTHRNRRSRDKSSRNDRRLRGATRARRLVVRRKTSAYGRSWKLRADAQSGRIAEHRAHDQSGAPHLCRGDAKNFRLESGILADIAPTLLFLLDLPKPAEMTGHNLLSRR